MAKAPRKKSFKWQGFRFQWMSHTVEYDEVATKRRPVWQYRVTCDRGDGRSVDGTSAVLVGWFDDVESAKLYLAIMAMRDVMSNLPPLEEYLRAIQGQVKALAVEGARVTDMLWAMRDKASRGVDVVETDAEAAKTIRHGAWSDKQGKKPPA